MLIRKPAAIPSSEITPKSTYLNRRNFLAGATIAGAAALTGVAFRDLVAPPLTARANTKIDGLQKSPFSTTEKQTPYKDITTYNNFYEFSTEKDGPADLAKNFRTRPWTVTIDGDVKKKQVLDVDTIIKMAAPEERIYRHRCVEGWSIVVPWVGFSLSELIKRAEPLPKAKVCGLHHPLQSKTKPGPAHQRAEVAFCRGSPQGGGYEPAGPVLFRFV